MKVADVTLSGVIREAGGKPAAGCRVAFLCDFQMVGEEFVDAVTKEVVTDKNGKFSVVFPQGANLQVMLPGGSRASFTLPQGPRATLEELLK
jgi:hypothetical protein